MFVISSQQKPFVLDGDYFSGFSDLTGRIDKGLAQAKRFLSIKEAQEKLVEISNHSVLHKCGAELSSDGMCCVLDAWRTIYYKIIAEDSVPYHDTWNSAFPIDAEHIPEHRPVVIVPRDGSTRKQQVSGNFLTDLMIKGDFYQSCDGYNRWEYDTDEKTIELYNIWWHYFNL